jgi:hypothetical protein
MLKAYTIETLLDGSLNIRKRIQLAVTTPQMVGIGVNSMHGGDESVDSARIPGEFGEVFDRVHHTPSSVSKREH